MLITYKDGTQKAVDDLRDANLRDANLWNANLRDANLWNADLWNADLRNANLRNANLQDANLQNANLRDANLQNANLQNAKLQNANLRTQKIVLIQTYRRQVIINGNEVFCGCFRGTISEFLMKNAIEHPTEYYYETIIMRDILRNKRRFYV